MLELISHHCDLGIGNAGCQAGRHHFARGTAKADDIVGFHWKHRAPNGAECEVKKTIALWLMRVEVVLAAVQMSMSPAGGWRCRGFMLNGSVLQIVAQ